MRWCRCSGRCRQADPDHYVRGQYEGYGTIDGVAPDSTTETYAALRLEIDNWRWSGVPFFLRTGKCLPVTQTELRVVFRRPPRLGFADWPRTPEPSQLVVKLDPTTGIRLLVDAQRHETIEPEQINLDMEFAPGGRRGPDALRGAPPRRPDRRQQALHPSGHRRGVLAGNDAAARASPTGASLREGIVGASAGRASARRTRPLARTVGDGMSTTQGQEECPARRQARRRRPRAKPRARRRAPPRRRRSRRSPTMRSCRTATPEPWSRPTGRSTGSAYPGSTPRACSARCLTAAPAGSGSGPLGSTCRAAETTSREPTRS